MDCCCPMGLIMGGAELGEVFPKREPVGLEVFPKSPSPPVGAVPKSPPPAGGVPNRDGGG